MTPAERAERRKVCEEAIEVWGSHTAAEYRRELACLDQLDAMEAKLQRVRGDINWMLNNREFLNANAFDYLDEPN